MRSLMFKIDLESWDITYSTENKKIVYHVRPGTKRTLLKKIIEANGDLVSTEELATLINSNHQKRHYGGHYEDFEVNSYDSSYISSQMIPSFRNALTKKFNLEKGSPEDVALSNLFCNKDKSYYINNKDDNNSPIFEIKLPKSKVSSKYQQKTNVLLNELISKIDEIRDEADNFNNAFFPKIKFDTDFDGGVFSSDKILNLIIEDPHIKPCLVLTGDIGSGKTSILHHICRTKLKSIYPIYISASDLLNDKDYIASEILYSYTKAFGKNQENTTYKLVSLLNELSSDDPDNTRIPLILIDGYDEMSIKKCDEVLNFVTKLLKYVPKARIIITTRSIDDKIVRELLNENIATQAKLNPLDRKILGPYANSLRFKQVTPLIASVYQKILAELETSQEKMDLHFDNHYQFYESYYKHVFSKKDSSTHKYTILYPYLAHKMLSEELNYLSLDSQVNPLCVCEYRSIFFKTEDIPPFTTLARDLVRAELLIETNSGKLQFRHNEIKDYMAAKFNKIRLEKNIDELDPLVRKLIELLLSNSTDYIYNSLINYCEFSFMAILDVIKDKKINTSQQKEILKLGLLIGYYQGYSVYAPLSTRIKNYLDSVTNPDYYVIAAINDYLYSILTTPLEKKEKAEFVSYIYDNLTKCEKHIQSMKSNKIPFAKEDFYLHGSAKSILESIGTEDFTKSPYDALLGVIHGNIGASHLERANKVLLDFPTIRSKEIDEAIKHHETGKDYKTASWGALHRNYIQLATDYYYQSKCKETPDDKRSCLAAAIKSYTDAQTALELEINHHDNKYLTIDSFIIPLNTAGCYYEQYKTYEITAQTSNDREGTLEGLKFNLLNGLKALGDYLSNEQTSSHYIVKEISNIYKDLTEKYLKEFRIVQYRATYSESKARFQMEDELMKQINNFCETYNRISLFNKISFKPESITITIEEKPYD